MLQHAAFGWMLRRLVEVGGIATFLVQIYLALPPSTQAAIQAVLTGDRSQQNLALAIGGLVLAGGGYIWSFRATTQTQAVNSDGHKIVPKADSVVAQQIDEVTVGVKPQSLKPTIFEQVLGGLFKRT